MTRPSDRAVYVEGYLTGFAVAALAGSIVWFVWLDGTRYELADVPRYKALGNAVTVNVIEWIAGRMVSL